MRQLLQGDKKYLLDRFDVAQYFAMYAKTRVIVLIAEGSNDRHVEASNPRSRPMIMFLCSLANSAVADADVRFNCGD